MGLLSEAGIKMHFGVWISSFPLVSLLSLYLQGKVLLYSCPFPYPASGFLAISSRIEPWTISKENKPIERLLGSSQSKRKIGAPGSEIMQPKASSKSCWELVQKGHPAATPEASEPCRQSCFFSALRLGFPLCGVLVLLAPNSNWGWWVGLLGAS